MTRGKYILIYIVVGGVAYWLWYNRRQVFAPAPASNAITVGPAGTPTIVPTQRSRIDPLYFMRPHRYPGDRSIARG